MTGALVRIDRHPIKSHGRETLAAVDVTAGQMLPWDRHWAVLHEAAKADGTEWAPCANFSRGSKAPGLMAIRADFDPDHVSVTLSHPDRPDALTFRPGDAADLPAFLDWVRPLMPADRAASVRIVSAGTRGMSDTDFPSISLLNLASIRALGDRLGQDLDPRRFRGNFWVDGLAGPYRRSPLNRVLQASLSSRSHTAGSWVLRRSRAAIVTRTAAEYPPEWSDS